MASFKDFEMKQNIRINPLLFNESCGDHYS